MLRDILETVVWPVPRPWQGQRDFSDAESTLIITFISLIFAFSLVASLQDTLGWNYRSPRTWGHDRQVPRLTSCGSQAGDQCLLKGVIFLFGLSQFRIGYGWASMAHIWNSTHLRKPLSTAQPSIHPLSALLVLILGRLQFASSSPPISLRLQFRLPPYSITDFFPTVKPYFWNTFLHVNHTVDQ